MFLVLFLFLFINFSINFSGKESFCKTQDIVVKYSIRDKKRQHTVCMDGDGRLCERKEDNGKDTKL